MVIHIVLFDKQQVVNFTLSVFSGPSIILMPPSSQRLSHFHPADHWLYSAFNYPRAGSLETLHLFCSSTNKINIKLNYWLLVIDGGAPHLPCSCESARGASRLNEWIYQLNVFYQPPPSLYRAGSFYIHLQFLHSVSCHNAILTIFSGHGHMILALYWALSIPPWLGPTLILWLEQHSLPR